MPKSTQTPKTEQPEVLVTFTGYSNGLAMPKYESDGAAGFDLLAAIPGELTIDPGDTALVPTGIIIEIPKGYEGQVRPRSGLALKKSVTILNAPGTVDSDFRGEVGVILVNLGKQPFEVRRGMRVAQMVIAPVATVKLAKATKVSKTDRGSKGFGSTGTGGDADAETSE